MRGNGRFYAALFCALMPFSGCNRLNVERHDDAQCEMKIIIPEGIKALKSFNDSSLVLNSKLRKRRYWIITFDAECSLCIAQLSKWNDVLRSIRDTSSVSIIFLPYGTSIAVLNFALKSANFNYPVYFDKQKSYYTANKLDIYPERESVLVDSNRCIIVEGSPVKENNLLGDYLYYLK